MPAPSTTRRALRGRPIVSGVVTCLVAFFALIALSPAAQADPSRNAGCTTKTMVQKYAAGGVTFYGQERNVRFCWTGGPVLDSKIKSITGSAHCWANLNNQVQNCVGPTGKAKIKISPTQQFGRGSATVYFWFQSRSCPTGPIGILCSPWEWHGAKYLLKQGGGVVLLDGDV